MFNAARGANISYSYRHYSAYFVTSPAFGKGCVPERRLVLAFWAGRGREQQVSVIIVRTTRVSRCNTVPAVAIFNMLSQLHVAE